MRRALTLMSELATILLAGETEAGNAEVQPARDSRFKAMNCCWGGRLIPVIPFCQTQSQFSVLKCLKKPDKKSPVKGGFIICLRQEKSQNNKVDLSNSR